MKQIRLLRAFSTSRCIRQQPRVNQVGIQYLSDELHRKVFPTTHPDDFLRPKDPELIEASKDHLRHNNLLGKKTQVGEPIKIPHFPDLVGQNTLDEHFHRLGLKSATPYLGMAEEFVTKSLPPRPQSWKFQSGWTRYEHGKDPVQVPFPQEDSLTFDVEVLYKHTHYACLCIAASATAWYAWVSPFLTEYAKDQSYNDYNHLIPFDCMNHPKLLVGHNVSYDRARVSDEYNIHQSKAFYLDTMALHIAVSGICSQQRPTWMKYKKTKRELEDLSAETELLDENDPEYLIAKFNEEDLANELIDDPWLNKGSPNSLASVADFHCGIKVDKAARDIFATLDPMEVVEQFQESMDYCAGDVELTFAVAAKLFPEFREKVPHPVSFAALRHLGTLMLPTTKKWDKYVETAEELYQENREEVTTILTERVNELIEYITKNDESLKPDTANDPWLRQLDWVLKEKRLKKNGEPVAKQAFLTGYPNWYRELFKNGDKELKISVRTRITPVLLKLKWEGYPLIWTDSCGWCFKVPYDEKIINDMLSKNYTKAELSEEDFDKFMPELRDHGSYHELFKVPHTDGKGKRCTSIMSKNYLRFFESGVLTSEYSYASEILKLNSYASYWQGNRTRISDQFVVYNDPTKNDFFGSKSANKKHSEMGLILPKLCTMGTITRRATENTWLTASNSKSTRIGSELKAMVEAPEGYTFVGADVDSEELWIASLIGDSIFKLHGGTALGWMTLEGDKNEKTDLHSKTADILGILRNDAKVFNYGRVYGAGVKYATQLLKQCNASLSEDEAAKIARELYVNTKGDIGSSKILQKRMYFGGTELIMFNVLEAIANHDDPKTPVLGASITDALTSRNLNKNSFLTSRVNWTIQSSGVDYLHLLVISMEYLIEKYKIDARLMITVHDEVRYIVKEEDRYKAALLLQISNVWTRAMFCEQLGIKDLPQSCAFFSEVDIDKVLRKEVTLDCVTPSHQTAIPPGESLDINKLLAVCGTEMLADKSSQNRKGSKLTTFKYKPRTPVMQYLDGDLLPAMKVAKVRSQTAQSREAWRKYMNDYIKLSRTREQRVQPKVPAQKVPSRFKGKIQEYQLSMDGQALLEQEVKTKAVKLKASTARDTKNVSKSPSSQKKASQRSTTGAKAKSTVTSKASLGTKAKDLVKTAKPPEGKLVVKASVKVTETSGKNTAEKSLTTKVPKVSVTKAKSSVTKEKTVLTKVAKEKTTSAKAKPVVNTAKSSVPKKTPAVTKETSSAKLTKTEPSVAKPTVKSTKVMETKAVEVSPEFSPKAISSKPGKVTTKSSVPGAKSPRLTGFKPKVNSQWSSPEIGLAASTLKSSSDRVATSGSKTKLSSMRSNGSWVQSTLYATKTDGGSFLRRPNPEKLSVSRPTSEPGGPVGSSREIRRPSTRPSTRPSRGPFRPDPGRPRAGRPPEGRPNNPVSSADRPTPPGTTSTEASTIRPLLHSLNRQTQTTKTSKS